MVNGKGFERSQEHQTWPHCSSFSWIIIFKNEDSWIIPQSATFLLCSQSNAFVRSMNITYCSLCYFWHFSWSCWRKKIPNLLALKSHGLSEKCYSSMMSTSQFSRIFANILPAMKPSSVSSLFLYRVIMFTSQRSCCTSSCSLQKTKNSWPMLGLHVSKFFVGFY